MVAPFHIGNILSIFDEHPLSGATTGPDTSDLQTAMSAVLIAHRATDGCKPTDDHMDAICRRSGAAVMAIMLAMKDASIAHAESAH